MNFGDLVSAGVENIPAGVNTAPDIPLNHLIWLMDYKMYGEKSYVYKNKEIFNDLLTSSIIYYDDTLTPVLLEYVDSNNLDAQPLLNVSYGLPVETHGTIDEVLGNINAVYHILKTGSDELRTATVGKESRREIINQTLAPYVADTPLSGWLELHKDSTSYDHATYHGGIAVEDSEYAIVAMYGNNAQFYKYNYNDDDGYTRSYMRCGVSVDGTVVIPSVSWSVTQPIGVDTKTIYKSGSIVIDSVVRFDSKYVNSWEYPSITTNAAITYAKIPRELIKEV